MLRACSPAEVMIPIHARSLFWDTNLETFDPAAHPVYTIERVLERGDEQDVSWLFRVFASEAIREVLYTDRRLSRRSANFWALYFGVPVERVAALQGEGA